MINFYWFAYIFWFFATLAVIHIVYLKISTRNTPNVLIPILDALIIRDLLVAVLALLLGIVVWLSCQIM